MRVFSKAVIKERSIPLIILASRQALFMPEMPFGILLNPRALYFAVADDDYSGLEYRITPSGDYRPKRVFNADDLFAAYVAFLRRSGADVICFAQGGDYIGGKDGSNVKNGFRVLRKMMNWYFFDADKPVYFTGVLNDDLNSSLTNAIEGKKIFTSTMNSIVQAETQSSKGG